MCIKYYCAVNPPKYKPSNPYLVILNSYEVMLTLYEHASNRVQTLILCVLYESVRLRYRCLSSCYIDRYSLLFKINKMT